MKSPLNFDKKRIFSIKKIKIGRKIFNSQNKIPNQDEFKQWTLEEDNLLSSLNNKYKRKRWIHISKYFINRSSYECMLRYFKINPNIKKGKWSFEEDRKLMYLIEHFGNNWSFISKIFKNRNHKQVRSRFFHYFIRYREFNRDSIKKIEESIKKEVHDNSQ